MEQALFDDLVQSLKEATAIARGEAPASRRIKVTPPDAKAVREQIGLSQSEFAQLMQVSIKTLQNWEQHRRNPRLGRSGSGRSGIVYWDNTGGVNSPIVGTYPSRDTMIVDPPTWLTSTPASFSVDGKLPLTGFFAAGLWLLDTQSATAPGSALITHGNNTANTARLTVFANNPLYRADPEREWAMLASAAYWADQ